MIKNIYSLNQKNSLDRVMEYNLCESGDLNEKYYGIQVKLISEKINEEIKIEDISCDMNFVMNIIDYLYENAVDIVHCKDIIEDYMLLLEIKE